MDPTGAGAARSYTHASMSMVRTIFIPRLRAKSHVHLQHRLNGLTSRLTDYDWLHLHTWRSGVCDLRAETPTHAFGCQILKTHNRRKISAWHTVRRRRVRAFEMTHARRQCCTSPGLPMLQPRADSGTPSNAVLTCRP